MREETVVHAHYSEALSAEPVEKLLASTLESTAMEPYQCGEALVRLRVVYVKDATLLPVCVGFVS